MLMVNAGNIGRWEADIIASVALYNEWFKKFAPPAFLRARRDTEEIIRGTFAATDNLCNIKPETLAKHPSSIGILRTLTMPPLARERLAGLAGVPLSLLGKMDTEGVVPPRMKTTTLLLHLTSVAATIQELIDIETFPWVQACRKPTDDELRRATYIIADRHSGAAADPIIRNEQERRQLRIIRKWLEDRKYTFIEAGNGLTYGTMVPGTFAFRLNISAALKVSKSEAEDAGLEISEDTGNVNIPVDAVIMPMNANQGDLPLLIEAKSAGDFTNTNKRWKEEATKMNLLSGTLGPKARYALFLCGYFGKKYLQHEASAGIDWVWEHRPDDLAQLGL